MPVTQNVPYGTGEWGSAITQSGAGRYPDPFCDIASEYVPRDLTTIFEWAEYLYMTFGTFRQVSRKVVRYFLTEVNLEGESEDERESYKNFLDQDLHLQTRLAEIGDDYMVYGNVFVSIFFPFDRFLICPRCRTHYRIDTMRYKFNLGRLTFVSRCEKCRFSGEFQREDRRSPDRSRVRLLRWNPKQIRLRVHPISGATEYYLDIDKRFVELLSEGNRFFLNDTPWPLVKHCSAVRGGSGAAYFKFNDDAIYHMKEATLAGLPIRGWGIPSVLPNFKLAYYMQILRRYDEEIALDFIIPFRVMYPKGGVLAGGQNDPLQLAGMTQFKARLEEMVHKKRQNVSQIQVAPCEIGYEMLGGEAKALAPKESIAQALDELLNACGYPAELYRGSLDIQAFPVALRLFEKTWGSLVDGYNDLISWVLIKISKYFQWGEMTGQLRSVTMADDIEWKALALQAAAGQDISKTTAYKHLDIDWMEEQRRVLEEQKSISEMQQDAMEESEQAQMGASPGGSGATPEMAGATPGDVHQQARDIAHRLVMETPQSLRRGELIKIKHSNPTLHALVMQSMDELRQELSRQGKAMLIQQGKTASAKGASLPSPQALDLLISQEIVDGGPDYFGKLAAASAAQVPGAFDAFKFVGGRLSKR